MAATGAAAATAAAAAPQWRTLIERSLKKNRSLAYSRYVQLATVRPDGRPACRTVVFRGFLDGADALTFVTDRRSEKVGQSAANPAAEVAWYLPVTREQYRVTGALRVVAAGDGDAALAAARRKAWTNMSDAGRSQFVWPHPGLPRIAADEAAFLQPAPDSAGDPVADFCLVVLNVEAVDYINLKQNRRIVFSQQQEGDAAAAAAAAGAQAAAAAASAGGGSGGDGSEGEGEVPRDPPLTLAGWTATEVNP
ncbi:hypothetical protein Rsub_12692 [Raphidocelis subcapitata]|uniref:Pyridoxamine 5'-phosphate oxidase Alr4036 family FMN-binding domain-containing protein n=1 Tax=Raphidocelis subcapitata TaxID=307507 RepID=A0A2V0PJK0_9CHLO|nr:hypothetical protein Rsub_12692 [Raphidocelis subcapitata]|eukprot:GBF99896.1 hypothetical protein Rsub_12692 [Raphidocelis subcapitata]